MENTTGMTDECTWATGLIIICMDKAFTNGLMGVSTRENT
jgi:hypothetical protein